MAKNVTGQRAAAALAASKGNPLMPNAKLKQLYATMLQCSLLDERLAARMKKRKLSAEYVSSSGREAIIVGAALDLLPTDSIAPAFGDLIAPFVKGLPLEAVIARSYAAKDKASSTDGREAPLNVIPSPRGIGAAFNIAVGVAFANRVGKSRNVVMAFATHASPSAAELREAINFAAAQRLPILFVIENSLPFSRRKEAGGDRNSLQVKDYDLPIIAVDGQDVVAIYRVVYESIHKARTGVGPTLIEARTFPSGNHPWAKHALPVTALEQMERYLTAKGLFSLKWKQGVVEKCTKDLDAAFVAAKNAALIKPI